MYKPTIEETMEDKDLCAKLAECLFDHIQTDDEPLDKIGYQLCEAYRNGNADGVLIAISGWSMDSLLELMAEQVAAMADYTETCDNEKTSV